LKKIILINSNNEHLPYPVPPIGLMLVYFSIKDKYDVKIVDGAFTTTENILDEIKSFNPDYIGISIRNIDNLQIIDSKCYFNHIKDNIIDPIRTISSSPIILGGSGFSVFAEKLMEYLDVNYGVVGEGEVTFSKLLDHLDNKKDPSSIPGVIVKGKADFIKNTKYIDVDKLPFTNFDKYIDFNYYKERSVYSIQTKRGCYHKCSYCTYPYIEGKKYRRRSPKDVADEIEDAYKRLGHLTFEFVDSTFNDPPGHAEEICKEIIKKKIKISLRTMGINPANASEYLFDLMLKAGFTQIDCTPDSASPTMIKNLRKNFTLEQLRKTANIIKSKDIPTMWFFILGGPGENEKTIDESFEFIDKYVSNLDMVHITKGLRIYPKTELYDTAVKEGVVDKNEDLIYPKFYITKELTLEELNKIIADRTYTRSNCIPAEESTPTKEMIQAAIKIRNKLKLEEPMFRTLLKLRQQIFNKRDLFTVVS
jgi:radical SAM superfamily enzyme YgiQ (UPF0313 family)